MKGRPGWLAGFIRLAPGLGGLLLSGASASPVTAGPADDGGESPGTVYLPLVLGAGTPQPLQIEYFSAVPETITAGECSLLEWGEVSGATAASIEPGIGGVATPGSQTVCPAATTKYVQTATGPGGVATASATVTVQRSTPTPEVWDPRLDELGVRLEPADVAEGEAHWALVEGRWASPDESNFLRHIYLEALDGDGQRAVGQPVIVAWADGSVTLQIEDKPPPEYGANFPMARGNILGTLDAWVSGGEPSDRVVGMGLGTAEHPDVNFHTCFFLTFQWVPAHTSAAPGVYWARR